MNAPTRFRPNLPIDMAAEEKGRLFLAAYWGAVMRGRPFLFSGGRRESSNVGADRHGQRKTRTCANCDAWVDWGVLCSDCVRAFAGGLATAGAVWLGRLLFVLALVAAASCGPVPAPRPPAPPSAESRTEAVHLGVPGCALTLEQDGQVVGTVTTDAGGGAPFVVTMTYLGGAPAAGTLNLAAAATCEGYLPWSASWVAAAHGNQDVCAGTGPCGPNQGLALPPLVAAIPPLQRVHVAGRGWATADGQPWRWHGITAFRLLEQVAHGQGVAADAFLAQAEAQHLTIVRVLAMAANLFVLTPEEGVSALDTLLSMAERHGLHVEVVLLADTKSYFDDQGRRLNQTAGGLVPNGRNSADTHAESLRELRTRDSTTNRGNFSDVGVGQFPGWSRRRRSWHDLGRDMLPVLSARDRSNGAIRNTKLPSYLSHRSMSNQSANTAHAVFSQDFSPTNRPIVMRDVGTLGTQNIDVLRPVVVANLVDVVNDFARVKLASDLFLGDDDAAANVSGRLGARMRGHEEQHVTVAVVPFTARPSVSLRAGGLDSGVMIADVSGSAARHNGAASAEALTTDNVSVYSGHIDTTSIATIPDYVAAVGAVLARHPSALAEIENEPGHETQLSSLATPASLATLRKLIPGSVPTALGSARDAIELPDPFCAADYCTVHSDRASGENGWRKARHVKDAVQDTADRVGKPVIDDEPWRADQDPDPAKQRALSWLEDGFQIGGTFHCASCLQGVWPTGAEAAALAARVQGWADLPPSWRGVYANAGFASSPLKSADFTHVDRAYSSVAGGSAYTFVLGLSGPPALDWAWPTRQLLVDLGAAQLWRANQ